ncbi:MAG: hypothetical protein AAF432_02105 [Planctomycetota bacterium]
MSRQDSSRWLILPGLAAALAAVGAIVLDPAAWATHAALPGATAERLEQLEDGATLLRWMLVLSALALASMPWLMSLIARPRAKPSTTPDESRQDWMFRIGLLAIGAGFIVRGLLYFSSLWYDEIVGLSFALAEPVQIVSNLYDPANHIFHTVLAHIAIDITGDVTVGLRLPALTASLLLIPILSWTGRDTDESPLFMATVATFAALLPVCVYEGVEARGYSLMMLFAATQIALFSRADTRSDARLWTVYAFLCALGIWAHLMTVWVPFGHGVYVLARCASRRSVRDACLPLTALSLGALLTITLYAPALGDLVRGREMFAHAEATPGLFGEEGQHILWQLGGFWRPAMAIPGLLLFLIGVSTLRDRPDRRRVWALSLLGLPCFIAFVAVADTWIYARFALFIMPGAILTMAWGFERVVKRFVAEGEGERASVPFLILAAIALMLMVANGTSGVKQPLRDAVQYVDAQPPAPKRVLAIGLAHEVLEIYATNDMDLRHSLRHGATLREDLDAHDPQWVIIYYPDRVDASRYDLLSARGFMLAEVFPGWVDWGRGNVEVWERK